MNGEYIFSMKFFRILIAVALSFSILFTFTVGLKRIGVKPEVLKKEEYKGIITLWHIDSFEGGRGSRKQFLLDIATAFEKKNKGVLVMVVSHTKVSAEEKFSKGEFPDMISFGGGVEIKNAVKSNFARSFKGGDISDENYFTPWCRGGYVLISNANAKAYEGEKLESVIVSQGEYTEPLIAMLENGVTATEKIILPPAEAYVEFTQSKTAYLLGTQRDVCRLISRGMEFYATPLSGFNDLYQYIGITSNDKDKLVYAERFIDFLTSDESQLKLNKISMFSAFIRVSFEDEILNEMQNATLNKTISVFTSSTELKNLQVIAEGALGGNENEKIKIEKMLF